MKSKKRLVFLAVSAACLSGVSMPQAVLAAAAAPAVAVQSQSLDELLKQVSTYKLGQSRRALEQVGALVIKAQLDAQQRPVVAAKLAGLLSGEATYEAKDFACRQLYLIGTAGEVPALAKLLSDEKLSHMARFVLERMSDAAADAALRQALGTVKGKALIGIVNSVGNRRDAQAIGALKGMLGGADRELAVAAATALGRIGGPEALSALAGQKSGAEGELRDAVLDAYLVFADEMLNGGRKAEAAALYQELREPNNPERIRVAALRGLVGADPGKATPMVLEMLKSPSPSQQALAGGFVRQMPGSEATRTFAAALAGLPSGGQVFVLGALAARGDGAAKPAVLGAAGSSEEAVRVAAFKALAVLGDASDVPLLAKGLGQAAAAEREAAREALARLRDAGSDAAVLRAIAAAEPGVKVELIKILSARRATSAVGALFVMAGQEEAEAVRAESLKALAALAAEKDYGALVRCLLEAKSNAERSEAKAAVVAVGGRLGSKEQAAAPLIGAMSGAPAATQALLVSTLAQIGGAQALASVRSAAQSPEAAVKEAAIRALAEWPDASAVTDMMGLARSENATHRMLALRGLLRVVALPSQRRAGETLKLYQEMLGACSRPEETRIVLAGLGDLKSAEALELVLPFLGQAEVRNEAAAAALKLAKAVGPKRPAGKAALEKIIASQASEPLRKQAQDAMDRGR